MAGPHAGIIGQRVAQIRFPANRAGEREGIQKRHVGPLPELRTGGMPAVTEVNDAAGHGGPVGAMAVAGEGKVKVGPEGGEEAVGLGPERERGIAPVRERRRAPGVMLVAANGPEIGDCSVSVLCQAAGWHDAGHTAGGLVALFECIGVEAAGVRPGQRRPERAIGKFPARRSGKDGAHAQCINNKVEGSVHSSAIIQKRRITRIGGRNARSRHDARACSQRRLMHESEQGGALDRYAHQGGSQGPVFHVQYNTVRRFRQSVEAPYRRAQLFGLHAQSEFIEDREARLLQDQAGPDRTCRLELVKHGYPVAFAGQEGSRRQPAYARPGNADIEEFRQIATAA